LGVITEAIFRLHPVPELARYVHATFGTAKSAAPAVAAVVGSQLAVSAVELDREQADGPVTICVLIEGSAPGVAARAERARQLLGAGAEIADSAPSWWGAFGDGALVKMTSQLTGVTALLDAVQQASAETGIPVGVRGSAGAGIVHAFFPWTTNVATAAQLFDQLRAACTKQGGFAVLLHAPPQLKAMVDVWGPVPGISIMQRIKDGFDPEHRFAPGRFVGGI
jgi:glycolate oxidase FAD binding subunit